LLRAAGDLVGPEDCERGGHEFAAIVFGIGDGIIVKLPEFGALDLRIEFADDRPAGQVALDHSHVRRFKLQARIFFCSRSSVSDRPPLGRARGTIMRTTVDHALIRGLVTAGPVMRRGASSV
jgi:hypothetical protein